MVAVSARPPLRHRAFGLQDRRQARQSAAECFEPVWSGESARQDFAALQRLPTGSHRVAPFGDGLSILAGRRAWMVQAGPTSAGGNGTTRAGRTDRAIAALAPAGLDRAGSADMGNPISTRCDVEIGVVAGRDHQRRARQSRSGAAGWALSDFRPRVAGSAGSTSAAVIPGRVWVRRPAGVFASRKARLRRQQDGGIRAGAMAGVVACRVWECFVLGFGSSRGLGCSRLGLPLIPGRDVELQRNVPPLGAIQLT